jgi:hypothetical protein
VVARPGTFQPGADERRNAGGRPKAVVAVIEAAREHTTAAIERLVFWMESDHPSASPAASQALLDRGWGKPVQPQEHSGEVIQRVISGEPLTPEQWAQKYQREEDSQ